MIRLGLLWFVSNLLVVTADFTKFAPVPSTFWNKYTESSFAAATTTERVWLLLPPLQLAVQSLHELQPETLSKRAADGCLAYSHGTDQIDIACRDH